LILNGINIKNTQKISTGEYAGRTRNAFPLHEQFILDCAIRHLQKYKELPTVDSKEPILGPDNQPIPGQTWSGWNKALKGNEHTGELRPSRGLQTVGSSLPELLNTRKDREFYGLCDLSEEMIIDCAKRHLQKYGALPTENSKEPILGPDDQPIPGQTWKNWNKALNGNRRNGELRPSRGLQPGSSLWQLLNTRWDREFYGLCDLSKEMIIDCAIRHLHKYKKLPTVDSKEPILGPDDQPIPGQTWSGWNMALKGNRRNGELRPSRGLQPGSSLAKLFTSRNLCNQTHTKPAPPEL
jgi:hypothetical protein